MGAHERPHNALLTAEGESTARLLMMCAAEYDCLDSEVMTRFAQVAALYDLRSDETAQSNTALAYVTRCVIVTEMFVFQRALSVLDQHARSISSPIFAEMYKTRRKSVDSSWENLASTLAVWPGLKIKDMSDWPAMNGYIAARNSWAHGQGRLTDRQRRNMGQTAKALSDAGLVLRGGTISVRPNQVIEVARTCRRFITDVDHATAAYVASVT